MHKNNFDFLRIFFSFLVLFTHTYPLTGGGRLDFFAKMTGTDITLSYIGVRGFFVISGYLIFQSLERSKSLTDYFWKRILRLYPGLLVVLCISVLLGIFINEIGVTAYLTNTSTWTYIPRNLSLYKLQYSIEGIFENNPFPKAINGSLWTLAYEFTCYGMLSFLFFSRHDKIRMRGIVISALVLLFLAELLFHEQIKKMYLLLNLEELANLAIYFLAGSFLASINFSSINLKFQLFLASGLLLFISFYFNMVPIAMFILLPIMVLSFGLSCYKGISTIGNSIGDLSYGIYIYSFPIQQALMHYFPMSQLQLLISSFVLTVLAAYFSWHYVEKPALKWKSIDPMKRILYFFKPA